MADHRLEVLRLGAARIAQVDLVVQAHRGNAAVRVERVHQRLGACRVGDAAFEAGRADELLERGDRCGLVVVGPLVHDLRAGAFGEAHEPGAADVELGLLGGNLLARPAMHLRRDEVGLADHRHPVERVLVLDARPVEPASPPQPFERRHDVVEVAVRLPVAHLRHLDGEREGVEQSERLGVVAVVLVGVARAGYCDERHRRHVDEHRQRPQQIQVLVFLLEIERGSHAVLRRSSGMVGRQSLAAPFQRSSVGSSASI